MCNLWGWGVRWWHQRQKKYRVHIIYIYIYMSVSGISLINTCDFYHLYTQTRCFYHCCKAGWKSAWRSARSTACSASLHQEVRDRTCCSWCSFWSCRTEKGNALASAWDYNFSKVFRVWKFQVIYDIWIFTNRTLIIYTCDGMIYLIYIFIYI